MFRCVFTVRFLAALVFSCAGGIGLCLDAAPGGSIKVRKLYDGDAVLA